MYPRIARILSNRSGCVLVRRSGLIGAGVLALSLSSDVALSADVPRVGSGTSRCATDQAQPYRFHEIQEPVNEASILNTLSRVEQLLNDTNDPHEIPGRDKYVSDFAEVLRMSNYQDRFVPRGGNLGEPNPARKGAPFVKMRMRTVARVIRCLGNLQAKEASTTLVEFLTFPADIREQNVAIATSLLPTHWALFQIGEPVLPALRSKLTNNDPVVRQHAAAVAGWILGPRAAGELERWIAGVDVPEERVRIEESRKWFLLRASHLGEGTFAEYRLRLLREERAYLRNRLKNPGLAYPDDMDEWRQRIKESRERNKLRVEESPPRP